MLVVMHSGIVEKNLEKSWENTVHQTERETKPSTPSMMTMISMNVVVGLLALCRVGTANADSGKIFDPNVFTDEEKQYIIDTYAGEGLIQYGKDTGCEIELTNNLYQTYRGSPFVELLYLNGTKADDGRTFYDVWNSELIGNQINTIQEGAIDTSEDPPSVLNFNNRLTMDMNIQCYKTQEDLGDLPLIKTYPFTSDPKQKVAMKYFAPVGVSPSGGAYNFDEPNFVYRWNTFLYYPRSVIYTLSRFDADGRLGIYVLQSFGNDINNQYTVDQLLLSPVNANVSTTNPLTPSITPPDGVVFGYVSLEDMLMVPSYGKATVVADNLGNAYQLIDRDAAPWLYDQYETDVRSAPEETPKKEASSSSLANAVGSVSAIGLLLGV